MMAIFTNKKFAELMIAEKYLPHLNSRLSKHYRIDYKKLIQRSDEDFPDVEIFNLHDAKDRLDVEVTKAPNLSTIEEHEGLEDKFIRALSKIINDLKIDGHKIPVSVSISVDRSQLKNHLAKEIELFNDKLPGFYLDSMIVEHRPAEALRSMGFKIITDLTIKEDLYTSLSHGWSEAANLDPLERVLNAINNKKLKIADPKRTVLLIYIDTNINDYYLNLFSDYFKKNTIPCKEIAVLENQKYGRLFFTYN